VKQTTLNPAVAAVATGALAHLAGTVQPSVKVRHGALRLNVRERRFGEHVVHRDITLSVLRGEVLCIVCSSGSGKTTLLREMVGLDSPTAGRVEVLGVTLSELGAQELIEHRRQSGVVFRFVLLPDGGRERNAATSRASHFR
jgi:ABC-type methionine transport system ATPase subunit